MSIRTLWLVPALLVAAGARAQGPLQYPANGHHYEVVQSSTGITWDQANAMAASMVFMSVPGHLVTYADAAEEQFVQSIAVGPLNDYALGAFQDMGSPDYSEPDGGWTWVTGEPWSYENWSAAEPNDTGGIEHWMAYFNDGSWNDVHANHPHQGFVVEYETNDSTPYCFGDGSGGTCPCGNAAGPDEGCRNSTGAGGRLIGAGSTSVANDDLRMLADQLLPIQPALLFVGDNAINGGDGLPFGDGLRCAGSNVVRLGTLVPDAAGAAEWGPGLGATGGWAPGDLRRFQAWYRDPAGSPCGSGFNLSNGVEVLFAP